MFRKTNRQPQKLFPLGEMATNLPIVSSPVKPPRVAYGIRIVYSCCATYVLRSGPEVIKLFSCSTQLSMKYSMLINLILPTTANSFLLNRAGHENLSAYKYENANYCWHFHIY